MATLDPKMVLVVEDEPLVRMVAAETLAAAGYLILEAGTGDEAIQIISAGAPLTAVVTELRCPAPWMDLSLRRQSKRAGRKSPLLSSPPDDFPRRMKSP